MIFLNPYTPPSEMVSLYADRERMAQANPRLEHYYENLEGSRTERFFDHCVEKLSSLIGYDGASLLDIGCGNGYFLSRAKRRGWSVKGLEPTQKNAQTAKRNFGIDVSVTDFDHYDGKDRFDCISLWDFIEHVPNPGQILSKVNALLKPNGIVLIATPDHFSLINFLADLIYNFSFRRLKKPLEVLFVSEHILYFTDKTLRRAVKESGFSLVEEMKTGTDIDRYQTGFLFNLTAKLLLIFSKSLRWENRIVMIARKKEPAHG